MKALKKIVVGGVAALALFGMTGCEGVNEEGSNDAISTVAVSFPDGSTVDCFHRTGMDTNTNVKCMWDEPSTSSNTEDKLMGSIQKASGINVRCVTDIYGALDCDIKEKALLR